MSERLPSISASEAANPGGAQAPKPAHTKRLMSLDALRGFDMMWIVGGAAIVKGVDGMRENPLTRFLSTQLGHSKWEGVTFFDLIFPLFLFITGVSMVYSLDKALEQGDRTKAIKRVLVRSLMLFAVGVIYYGGIARPWPDVQLGGVLQRIALCYLFGALVYCFIRCVRGLLIASSVVLLGYWALLAFVPFPDLVLDKANVQSIAQAIDSQSPFEIAAAVPERVSGIYEEGRNLTNYMDFLYLPGFKKQHYYINEGLLSTLPAIAYLLIGALVGRLFKDPEIPDRRKLAWLIGGGVGAILVGLLWGLSFPLVKRIWTSSFVLLTIGLSSLLLALFYYLIDMRRYRAWCQPFVWIGCNALTIYVGSKLLNVSLLAKYLTGGDLSKFLNAHVAQGAGGVCTALAGLLLVIGFARFLYKRNLFIRL